MNIVSLVLRIHPETRAEAEAALLAFPGVECHGMSDTLIALHRVPQVLAATLAYEHTDAMLPEASASQAT